MNPADENLERFVALSSLLTGYSRAELWGTGMVRPYWSLLERLASDVLLGRLLSQGEQALRSPALVSKRLLPDPDTGPLARNLIALWYLGLWNQLPLDWRDRHGAHAQDVTHYPSPEAYTQGLVWQTMHAHPQGAHQGGYGSWSLPPIKEAKP